MRALLASLLLCGWALAGAPDLRVAPARIEASPRETVMLTATFVAGDAWRGEVRAELPLGWRLLASPPALDLAPGETGTALLPLRVPQEAAAGEVAVRLELSGGAAPPPVEVRVRVREARTLELAPLEAPAWLLEGPFEASFALRNAGNVPQTVRLRARSSHGFEVAPDPAGVTLAPFEMREIRVRVRPPEEGSGRPLRHHLTLIASAPGDPAVEASASASSDVLTRGPAPAVAARGFDLRLQLGAGIDATSGDAGGALRLRGDALVDADSGARLELDLRAGAGARTEERATVVYRDPAWELSGGHLTAAFGTLTPIVSGFGVAFGSGAAAATEFEAFALARDGAPRVGVRVGGAALPGVRLAGHAVVGVDETVLGARAEVAAGLPAGARLAVGIEPALDARSGALAGRIDLRGGGADVRFDGALDYRPAGFRGAERASASGAARLRIRAPRDPGVRLRASVRASDDGAVALRSFGVGLEADAERKALPWSVAYNVHEERSGARAERTRELRGDVTLGLAGGANLDAGLAALRAFDDETGPRDELRLELAGRLPAAGGRLEPGATFAYDPSAARPTEAFARLAWHGRPAPRSDVSVGIETGFLPAPQLAFDLDLLRRAPTGAAFRASLEVGLPGAGDPRLRADVGLELPLRLPLGGAEAWRAVRGRIVDERGRPVPGLVATLAGVSAATDADGAFAFPAVPRGEHALLLLGLEPGRVTLPTSPIRVRVADDDLDLEFRVVPAALLTGRVTLAPTAASATGAVVHAPSGAADLRGVAIEIEGPDGRRRLTVDRDGAFRSGRLAPGRWRVRVVEGTLPPFHRALPAERAVDLVPGARRDVAFEIAPLERPIRFTGGGELSD